MNYDIDTITIAVSAALILIAILGSLCSPFFRKKLKTEPVDVADNQDEEKDYPSVSLLFNIVGEWDALKRNLPAFLEQEYKGQYNVIIVIREGDEETESVSKLYENDPRVYCTYVPKSSRYMSKPKLAVTLGCKASKSDWILMADITAMPSSNNWLTSMVGNIKDGTDIVLGYCKYDSHMSALRRFAKLHTFAYLVKTRGGIPYRSIGNNILFRREMFMEQDGYRGNLKYIGGEYDFIVNKFATAKNTTTTLDRDTWLLAEIPTDKSWRNAMLFYQETRKHLKHSKRHRLPYMIDMGALYFTFASALGLLVASVLLKNWIVLGASILALIIAITLRTYFAKRFAKAMDERIPAWSVVPLELLMPVYNLRYRLKYLHSDKYDFISHKI